MSRLTDRSTLRSSLQGAATGRGGRRRPCLPGLRRQRPRARWQWRGDEQQSGPAEDVIYEGRRDAHRHMCRRTGTTYGFYEGRRDAKKRRRKSESPGSRTRVYCSEGNYPNRWTTYAIMSQFKMPFSLSESFLFSTSTNQRIIFALTVHCTFTNNANTENVVASRTSSREGLVMPSVALSPRRRLSTNAISRP